MVRNIAHRGFSGLYPENTMLAFEKALEAGAEGIEFDVHLSRDGVPVIIHDETLDRTTNGAGLVAGHTVEQLKALDASAEFPGRYGVNGIPLLEEYLELVRDRDILTNIELKTGVIWYEGLEEKTLALIDRYGLRDRMLISSFNHFSVLRMREMAPDIGCAFLEESRLIDPAGYLAKHGVFHYHPLCYNMTPDVVAQLRERNIAINVWTVNEEAEMEAMLRAGVDGVITNYPDRFARVRQRFAQR